MAVSGRIKKTRFAGLGFNRQKTPDGDLWRVVDCHDNNPCYVGPQYKSKAELLADLDRYAKESWSYN